MGYRFNDVVAVSVTAYCPEMVARVLHVYTGPQGGQVWLYVCDVDHHKEWAVMEQHVIGCLGQFAAAPRSNDDGATWRPIGFDAPDLPVLEC